MCENFKARFESNDHVFQTIKKGAVAATPPKLALLFSPVTTGQLLYLPE